MRRQFFVGDQHVNARVIEDVTPSTGLRKLLMGTTTAAALRDAENAGMNSGRFLGRADAIPGCTEAVNDCCATPSAIATGVARR